MRALLCFFSDWEPATVKFCLFYAGRIGLSLLFVFIWCSYKGPLIFA